MLDPLSHTNWDCLVASHPGATIFHTAAWARVLRETYSYAPLYLAVREGDRLLGLLPIMEVNSTLTGKRGVSLPFADYCTPLLSAGLEPDDLWNLALETANRRRWKYLEIRGSGLQPLDAPPSDSFLRHKLDLTDGEESLFAGLRSSNRRNIQKSKREGVEVRFDTSPDAMREYYRLHGLTRKRHGLPPQSWTFFSSIQRNVLDAGLGFVALGSYNNLNIAAAVYFSFGRNSLYKYGASDYAYQHLRANNLIMWEAIRRLSGEGNRSLCFGRTDLEDTGLREFKAGWGACEEEISYYRFDLHQNAFAHKSPRGEGLHRKFFQTAPMLLSRLIGSVLYRHVA